MSSGYKLAGPSAMESPYIPSSDSNRSGSPDYPGESVPETPVQSVTYKEVPSSAYNPTFAQYMNHSDYSQADPIGSSRGVSDVDFDNNTGTAYASLNEFQDRKLGAAKLNMTHAQGNEYPSVPNKAEERVYRNVRCMLIVLIVLIVFTLIISLIAVGFALYNFLNTFDDGRLLPQGTVSPLISGDPALIESLQARINELESNLTHYSNQHTNRFFELGDRYEQLTTLIENATQEAQDAVPSQLPLYANCTKRVEASCNVQATMLTIDNAEYPNAARCETPSVAVDVPGLKNINMYCSAGTGDDGVIQPFMATLNIYDGEALCVCYLLALQDRLTVGLNFPCELTVERCPLLFNLTAPALV